MSTTNLEQQFKALDTDNSGLISPDELLSQMPDGTLENARGVLAMLDENQDGQVSYMEFIRFYQEIEPSADDAMSHVDDVDYVAASDSDKNRD